MKQQSSLYQKIAYFDKKYQILFSILVFFPLLLYIGKETHIASMEESKFQPGKVYFENYVDEFVMKYSRNAGSRYISFYRNNEFIWTQNCVGHYLENNICQLKEATLLRLNYTKVISREDPNLFRYTILSGTYDENGREKKLNIDEKKAREWFYDDNHYEKMRNFFFFVLFLMVFFAFILIFCRVKERINNVSDIE